MIKLENIVLANPEQMEFIIQGMRNSMNSWEKSDSHTCRQDGSFCMECKHKNDYCVGENDHSLISDWDNCICSTVVMLSIWVLALSVWMSTG